MGWGLIVSRLSCVFMVHMSDLGAYTAGWGQRVVDVEEADGILEGTAVQRGVARLLGHGGW
jgi:hypothetical protein